MRREILVPLHAKNCFSNYPKVGVALHFYEFQNPSLKCRFKRKFGISTPEQQLEESLHILSGKQCLSNVQAAWLCPSVLLSDSLTEVFLNSAPNLKWVYSQRSGTDHIPLDLYLERGVVVSNTGTLVSDWVAEMIIAGIACQVKRIPEHIRQQSSATWRSLPAMGFDGLTVGILGSGHIGKRVAKMCKALGMKTIGTTRSPDREFAGDAIFDRVIHTIDEQDVLLRESDFVVIALPLTEETYHFISKEELSMMKPSATLLNYSRSSVVDFKALIEALKRKRIAAVYTDFLEENTWKNRMIVRRLKGFILTHNSSANSPQKLDRAFKQFMQGLEIYCTVRNE